MLLTAKLPGRGTLPCCLLPDLPPGAGRCSRYGLLFSYPIEAVSVAGGGIIAKRKAWVKKGVSMALALEDPQQLGRWAAGAACAGTGAALRRAVGLS